jgi:hypothetical protein
METILRQLSVRQHIPGELTAILIAEEEVTLLRSAVDDPHTHSELLASLPSRCGLLPRGVLLRSRTALQTGAGPCLVPGDGGLRSAFGAVVVRSPALGV